MKNLHKNTRYSKAKKEYTCEKCGHKIKIGEMYFLTNTKFIKPFARCACCKPSAEEINRLIREEIDEYTYNLEDIEIADGDF